MGVKQRHLHESKRQAEPPKCHTCGAPPVGKLAKPDRHGRDVHYCAAHTPHDVLRFRLVAQGKMILAAKRGRMARLTKAA